MFECLWSLGAISYAESHTSQQKLNLGTDVVPEFPTRQDLTPKVNVNTQHRD